MPTPLRAASLAAWGSAYLNGAVALQTAVRRIEGDDEPHLVVHGSFGPPDELAEALTELRAEGVAGLRLALPAPGDLLGLVGPPAVNQHVVAAGEAAIAVRPSGARTRTPTRSRVVSRAIPGEGVVEDASAPAVPAFLPEVAAFGPPDDQGHCVTWRVWPSSPATPDVPDVAQAERELAAAMREATDALSAALVVRAPGEAAEVAQRLRRWDGPLMPDVAGGRAESLAQRAVQVASIVEAARAEDGQPLTAHSAAVRAAALAPLERAARRALVAAVGACCPEVALR